MEALGVMVEVIFCRVVDGVLESRPGLLRLPLCPVYGIGGVACTLFLHRVNPGTDHRARCQVPVLAKRMSPGRSHDMINMSV